MTPTCYCGIEENYVELERVRPRQVIYASCVSVEANFCPLGRAYQDPGGTAGRRLRLEPVIYCELAERPWIFATPTVGELYIAQDVCTFYNNSANANAVI
jgi:hypothetical protein